MKVVAFFRNLNLGRAHCPDKAGFEQAFIAAGALSASSFLTNGSMVFEADSQRQAQSILARACVNLHEACGMKEPAYIRSIEELAALVALDPFADAQRDNIHEFCVSFLPPHCALPEPMPTTSRRGDVHIVQRTAREVLSLSLKIGNTPGSPNAYLEKLLGVPVTTRSWNTVVRLLRKYA